MKKWSHQVRRLCGRGVREHAFAPGKIQWDSGRLLIHGTMRFYFGQKDLCLSAAQRQEASTYLGYRFGQYPRSVTPRGVYKQQWGPELLQPGGAKRKAQSRNQKPAKGLVLTAALSVRASVGEGTKPKITKFTKVEVCVELDNQVITQIFHVPLLPVDEQQEDSRSSKWEWQKPLQLWCKNWTCLLEM